MEHAELSIVNNSCVPRRNGLWVSVAPAVRMTIRKLVIEETEAETVRHLFRRYLKLGSVRALMEEANMSMLQARLTRGAVTGKPFGRGNLYHLLSNPIYIGKIRHRDLLYDASTSRSSMLGSSQRRRRCSPHGGAPQELRWLACSGYAA